MRRMKTDLKKKGYFKLTEPLTVSTFYRLGKSFGEIFLKCDVKYNPNATEYLFGKDKMAYHMDHFDAHYIAWFGMVKNDLFEPTLLIDSRNIIKKLTQKDLRVLSRIKCQRGEFEVEMYNLKTKRFYYCPWLVTLSALSQKEQTESEKVLKKLDKLIEKEHKNNRIEVHLNKGEALFIDSRFILHGRGEIAFNSKRHLKRIWVHAK